MPSAHLPVSRDAAKSFGSAMMARLYPQEHHTLYVRLTQHSLAPLHLMHMTAVVSSRCALLVGEWLPLDCITDPSMRPLVASSLVKLQSIGGPDYALTTGLSLDSELPFGDLAPTSVPLPEVPDVRVPTWVDMFALITSAQRLLQLAFETATCPYLRSWAPQIVQGIPEDIPQSLQFAGPSYADPAFATWRYPPAIALPHTVRVPRPRQRRLPPASFQPQSFWDLWKKPAQARFKQWVAHHLNRMALQRAGLPAPPAWNCVIAEDEHEDDDHNP